MPQELKLFFSSFTRGSTALLSPVHMASQKNNCRRCFSILGGTWESTIAFYTFNLKASKDLTAQISTRPACYLDVYKLLFQKTGTNKRIISVEEQEQSFYLLTLSQKKTKQKPNLLHLWATLPRFSLQPVLFRSSIEFPLEKKMGQSWNLHKVFLEIQLA